MSRFDASIIQSSAVVYASRLVNVLVNIALVPIALSAIGERMLGLVLIVQSTLVILNIADFGLGASLRNLVAEARARGEWWRIRAAVGVALRLYAGIAAGIAAVGIGLAWALPGLVVDILGGENIPSATAVRVFAILTASAAAQVFMGIWRNLAQGMQWVGLLHVYDTTGRVASLIAVYLALEWWPSAESFVVARAAAELVPLVVFTCWVLTRHPGLRPTTAHATGVPGLRTTSLAFFILMINGMLFTSTDNLILSHVCGIDSVAGYNIGYRLFVMPSDLVGSIAPVLWPAITAMGARADAGGLRRAYRAILRYTVFTHLGLVILLLLSSKAIIELWVGPTLFAGTHLMTAFAVAILVFAWTGVHALFCNSLSQLRVQVVASSVGVVINLVASVVLARRFGPVGVAWGTVLGVASTTAIVLPMYVSKLVEVRPLKELGDVLWDQALPLSVLLVGGLALWRTNASSLAMVAITGLIFLVFTLMVLRLSLDDVEREQGRRIFGRLAPLLFGR